MKGLKHSPLDEQNKGGIHSLCESFDKPFWKSVALFVKVELIPAEITTNLTKKRCHPPKEVDSSVFFFFNFKHVFIYKL